jgi:hypothetical protein
MLFGHLRSGNPPFETGINRKIDFTLSARDVTTFYISPVPIFQGEHDAVLGFLLPSL